MAKGNPVAIDDLIATSTEGVLRALDARRPADKQLSTEALVKSGFGVSIHIVCGGRLADMVGRLGDSINAGNIGGA